MNGDTVRLGYRPALDTLRALAVLQVVAYHAHLVPWDRDAGVIGVGLFLALSGFLITTLILDEQEGTGRLWVAGFYARRALRLLPALAVLLAVVWVTMAAAGQDVTTAVAAAALYVANFMPPHAMGPLEHTWTLALEEQFYLVWPAVMLATRRPGPVALTGALVLGLGRFVGMAEMFGPLNRADPILVGCLVAVLYREGWRAPRWIQPAGWMLVALPAFDAADSVKLAAIAWGSGIIVWCWATRPPTWASRRTLVEVGRRSYGIYLWHVPLLAWLPVPAALVATVVAVEGSWRLVERPFLRLKGRWSPSVELPDRQEVHGRAVGRLVGTGDDEPPRRHVVAHGQVDVR